MLTLGVWILVAWFVGIPLALCALYGVALMCRGILGFIGEILEGIGEVLRALLQPFTADGRTRMLEEGRIAREKAQAALAKAAGVETATPDMIRRHRRGQYIALAVTVVVGAGLGALIGVSQSVH